MKVSIIQPAGAITAEAAKDNKLTQNFTLGEMANLAGDPALAQYLFSPASYTFMLALQNFRHIVKRPVVVNSGYRQYNYNKRIGGDANSLHLKACAADIQPIAGMAVNDYINTWFNCLGALGLMGAINIYPGHTYYHLEAFSDTVYGYSKQTVRVYSSDAEYKQLINDYAAYTDYINIMRFK